MVSRFFEKRLGQCLPGGRDEGYSHDSDYSNFIQRKDVCHPRDHSVFGLEPVIRRIVIAGAKGVWLQQYKELEKVQKSLQRGHGVYVNLEQKSMSRPICGKLLPCLCKSGTLWHIQPPASGEADVGGPERMLTGQDCHFLCVMLLFQFACHGPEWWC